MKQEMKEDCAELIESFQGLPGRCPDVLWRERVRLFYKHHNPAKIGDVPTLLARAPRQAELVFRMLEDAYGLKYSNPPGPESPAHASSPTGGGGDTSPIRLTRVGGPKARGQCDGELSSSSSPSPPASPSSPKCTIGMPMTGQEAPSADGGAEVEVGLGTLAARRKQKKQNEMKESE